jgi:predicted lipoprotein
MLYWPDRKSIGLKQVQAALAAKDPTASDPAQLAGKSVAMQGLGALEFVLYGDGSEALAGKDDPYRCAYGAAIAKNTETMAADVDAAWKKPDGFAALWANPGPDNALYRDGTEAVTELVGVFINELEMVRDVRLKGFLGAKPDADKPRQAIFWRSRNTGLSLAGNLSGIDTLFEASKLGDALPEDARWMAESIHIQLVNGIATARSVQGPIDKALADPVEREKLEHFALITSSLSGLIGTRLTAEFGLTAGFSSLDGD